MWLSLGMGDLLLPILNSVLYLYQLHEEGAGKCMGIDFKSQNLPSKIDPLTVRVHKLCVSIPALNN